MYYIKIRDNVVCQPAYLCYDKTNKMYWWGMKENAIRFTETQIKPVISYVKHTYLASRATNGEIDYEKV